MVQIQNTNMDGNKFETVFPVIICAKCDQHLSSAPVFVREDGESICKICANHNEPRNLTYEALAEFMIFPCKNQSKGCHTQLKWNESLSHENTCRYTNSNSKNFEYELVERCDICKRFLASSPRYQCFQNHFICSNCRGNTTENCPLCTSKIETEMSYLCRYCHYGCDIHDTKDKVIRHEIDCEMRKYNCPLLEDDYCKWIGPVYQIKNHLKSVHPGKLHEDTEMKRMLKNADDFWIMSVGQELFKCYLWIYDTEIEWIAKLIGPQHKSYMYEYELKINNANKKSLTKKNICQGWNNATLEKSIKFDIEYLKTFIVDGKINYTFKIYAK